MHMHRHDVFSVEFDQIMARAVRGEVDVIGWAAQDNFRFWYPHRPVPLKCLVDSNPLLHGQTVFGFSVHPPSLLADADPRRTILIIYSAQGVEIAKQIKAAGDFQIFWGLPQEVPDPAAASGMEDTFSAFAGGALLPLEPAVATVETPLPFAPFATAVEAMEEELAAGPSMYRPSPYWLGHAKAHLEELKQHGLGRFKYLLNAAYYEFQVTDPRDHLLQRAVRLWSEHMSLQPLVNVMQSPERFASPEAARLYSWFVGLIWEFTLATDPLGRFGTLEEPLLGDPIRILRQGRRISQDLVHSYHELCTMVQHAGVPLDRASSVAELGAGYGRLAYVALKTTKASYTVIDIPPALGIAQAYLQALFPDLPAFRFRRFSRFEEVADEFEAAHIRFLTPNQMALLPDEQFDHFVGISNLHEMTGEQVRLLLRDACRTTRRSIYLKQWYRGLVDTGDGRRTANEYKQALEGWHLRFDRSYLLNPAMVELVASKGTG